MYKSFVPTLAISILLFGYSSFAQFNNYPNLDVSFDHNGILFTAAGYSEETATKVAFQSNGKMIVAGYEESCCGEAYLITRFDTNGVIDDEFGLDGQRLYQTFCFLDDMILDSADNIYLIGDDNDYSDFAYHHLKIEKYGSNGDFDSAFYVPPVSLGTPHVSSIALQSDGKLVVLGEVYDNQEWFYVERLHPDGSLDSTFASDGISEVNPGQLERSGKVLIQADGKFVCTGRFQSGNSQRFIVFRMTSGGNLDNTFDGDGKAIFDYGDTDLGFSTATLQPDGKIIAAGVNEQSQLILSRLNENGTLDSTFADSGYEKISVNAGDLPIDMNLQNDGKILLTVKNLKFTLYRFNSDGSLDSSFDSDGKFENKFGLTSATSYSEYIQQDSKIMVAGEFKSLKNGNQTTDFGMVRLNADGSIDSTFGIISHDSKVINTTLNNDALIDANGRILVATGFLDEIGEGEVVIRFNADGSRDTTFGYNGEAIIPNSYSWSYSAHLALQADGKIVVTYRSYVARLTQNGIVDSTFGSDGIVDYNWPNYTTYYSIACQNDGKILIGGQVDPNYYGIIVRLNSDGSLDETFNGSGYLNVDFSEQASAVRTIRVDSSGRILISVYNYNDTYFVLMRLLPDGSLDDSFNSDGELIESETSYCNDLFLLPDGKILGVGSFDYVSTLFQLLEDGTYDTSFGIDGKVSLPFGGALSIARLSDGRIALGGGDYYSQTGSDVALFLLNKNGTFDMNLDSDGVQVMDVGSTLDNCMKSLVQSDDKIILVGVTPQVSDDRQIFILRIEPPIFTADNSTEAENRSVIYPNPALNSIQVKISNSFSCSFPIRLSVFDLLGEKVKEQKVFTGNVSMDVSDLPAGMYAVRADEKTIGKFVKQ